MKEVKIKCWGIQNPKNEVIYTNRVYILQGCIEEVENKKGYTSKSFLIGYSDVWGLSTRDGLDRNWKLLG